jgi:phospholipase/carboxylesterase
LKSAGLQVDFIESQKKHVLEETEYPLIRKWVRQQIDKIQSDKRI